MGSKSAAVVQVKVRMTELELRGGGGSLGGEADAIRQGAPSAFQEA